MNHTTESTVTASWLHEHVRAAAAYCLGLDVLEAPVARLSERGYNVREFDVTAGGHLGETFDLVIAGELLEHLGHPQRLFDFARDHLAPGGRLILSTPHPYYLTRTVLFLRNRAVESVDHVAFYFPSGVAELAERSGLRLAEYRGVLVPIRSWRGRAVRTLGQAIGMGPEALCDTMIYTCERVAA